MEPLLSSVYDTILHSTVQRHKIRTGLQTVSLRFYSLLVQRLSHVWLQKKSFVLKGAAAARLSSWSPNYDNEVPPFLPLCRSLRQRVFTLDRCLWRRHFFWPLVTCLVPSRSSCRMQGAHGAASVLYLSPAHEREDSYGIAVRGPCWYLWPYFTIERKREREQKEETKYISEMRFFINDRAYFIHI